jgi:hypothetical protein
MVTCSSCGRPFSASESELSFRSGDALYHVACAPTALLDSASEEFEAVLRKGIRYFVEKYSGPEGPPGDPGARFLALGRAIEQERSRRKGTAATPAAGARGV